MVDWDERDTDRGGNVIGVGIGPTWARPLGGDLVRTLVATYGTPAFLLGDTNPAVLLPSGLQQNYLESTGLTPASASGETIGLQLDRSQGAVLGANIAPLATFADASTLPATYAAGVLNSPAGEVARARASFTTIVGRAYRLRIASNGTTSPTLGGIVGTSAGGSQNGTFSGTQAAGGPKFFATATTTHIQMSRTTAGATTILSVTVEEIAGNHAYQATAADEPALILDSGIWRYRGDGVSDNLLTSLVPATSMTIMAVVKPGAINNILFGVNDAGNNRSFIGVGMLGYPGAGLGSLSLAHINIGVDKVGVAGIQAFTFTPSMYRLTWWDLAGGAPIVVTGGAVSPGAQLTIPFRFLSYNSNGTAASWFTGDCPRLLAQQSAYSAADEAAVAAQWKLELGGLFA